MLLGVAKMSLEDTPDDAFARLRGASRLICAIADRVSFFRARLHPDLKHRLPKGGNWDLHTRGKRGKISLRQIGSDLEFWSEETLKWLGIEELPIE